MPKIKINDTTIAYETWGDGPAIVLSQHGWFPRVPYVYILAGRLSKQYQVILWDRPNGGASDINIADVPKEHDLWTDVMHGFLEKLGVGPAYFCGASNGCVFSQQMAYRYPADVKGLILLEAITDDLTLNRPIVDARYLEFAEIARAQGMQAVFEHSKAAWARVISTEPRQSWDVIRNWIAETIAMNPVNEERLMEMDPSYFAKVMQQWGDWYLTEHLNTANLSVAELSHLSMPALVVPGIDPLHPQHSAAQLAERLPNAELVDYLSRYSTDEFRAIQESDAVFTQKAFLMLPFIEDFLARQR